MKRIAAFLVLVMLFPSCVTAQEAMNRDKIDLIVKAAYALNGKSEVVVGGQKFNSDCSGLIYGLYSAAGIDLQSAVARYKGDGVKRIYQLMDENGLLYYAWVPVPGDLIFWDNTYDKNGDGRENDYLTHIGVVVSVEDDGQISYIHYHTGRGIMIDMFMPMLLTEKPLSVIRICAQATLPTAAFNWRESCAAILRWDMRYRFAKPLFP